MVNQITEKELHTKKMVSHHVGNNLHKQNCSQHRTDQVRNLGL